MFTYRWHTKCAWAEIFHDFSHFTSFLDQSGKIGKIPLHYNVPFFMKGRTAVVILFLISTEIDVLINFAQLLPWCSWFQSAHALYKFYSLNTCICGRCHHLHFQLLQKSVNFLPRDWCVTVLPSFAHCLFLRFHLC